MDKSIFIRADELAAELDVSKALAYKMINQWNEELKAKGYTTVGGRVSRQYYYEKIYGAEKEKADACVCPTPAGIPYSHQHIGSYGSIEGGGYIWHTTGSGKTLTSFKTARLASQLPYILILKNQQATSTTAISWKNEHPQIASLNKFV